MKITAIGCGPALAPISIGNSNFLFEENGKFLMMDFGTTAVYILRDEFNIPLSKIDGVYISHCHQDHIGSMEYLAFNRYFCEKPVRPKLYTASCLMKPLWENSLRGGLDGIHGKTCTLSDFFECFPISKNKYFVWEGVKFTPVQTVHVNCGYEIKNSYGLFIENPKTGSKTFITGDTVFSPDSMDFLYKTSDLILHDCEVGFRSRVHSNWEDLKTLPPEIRKKIWCYHNASKPEDIGDFGGFVYKGKIFEV